MATYRYNVDGTVTVIMSREELAANEQLIRTNTSLTDEAKQTLITWLWSYASVPLRIGTWPQRTVNDLVHNWPAFTRQMVVLAITGGMYVSNRNPQTAYVIAQGRGMLAWMLIRVFRLSPQAAASAIRFGRILTWVQTIGSLWTGNVGMAAAALYTTPLYATGATAIRQFDKLVSGGRGTQLSANMLSRVWEWIRGNNPTLPDWMTREIDAQAAQAATELRNIASQPFPAPLPNEQVLASVAATDTLSVRQSALSNLSSQRPSILPTPVNEPPVVATRIAPTFENPFGLSPQSSRQMSQLNAMSVRTNQPTIVSQLPIVGGRQQGPYDPITGSLRPGWVEVDNELVRLIGGSSGATPLSRAIHGYLTGGPNIQFRNFLIEELRREGSQVSMSFIQDLQNDSIVSGWNANARRLLDNDLAAYQRVIESGFGESLRLVNVPLVQGLPVLTNPSLAQIEDFQQTIRGPLRAIRHQRNIYVFEAELSTHISAAQALNLNGPFEEGFIVNGSFTQGTNVPVRVYESVLPPRAVRTAIQGQSLTMVRTPRFSVNTSVLPRPGTEFIVGMETGFHTSITPVLPNAATPSQLAATSLERTQIHPDNIFGREWDWPVSHGYSPPEQYPPGTRPPTVWEFRLARAEEAELLNIYRRHAPFGELSVVEQNLIIERELAPIRAAIGPRPHGDLPVPRTQIMYPSPNPLGRDFQLPRAQIVPEAVVVPTPRAQLTVEGVNIPFRPFTAVEQAEFDAVMMGRTPLTETIRNAWRSRPRFLTLMGLAAIGWESYRLGRTFEQRGLREGTTETVNTIVEIGIGALAWEIAKRNVRVIEPLLLPVERLLSGTLAVTRIGPAGIPIVGAFAEILINAPSTGETEIADLPRIQAGRAYDAGIRGQPGPLFGDPTGQLGSPLQHAAFQEGRRQKLLHDNLIAAYRDGLQDRNRPPIGDLRDSWEIGNLLRQTRQETRPHHFIEWPGGVPPTIRIPDDREGLYVRDTQLNRPPVVSETIQTVPRTRQPGRGFQGGFGPRR